MAAPLRLRDAFDKEASPWWLKNRREQNKTVGYRFLWSMVSVLDCLAEALLQGMQASWPGVGTPTALPLIGRSRGILRGQADTNDEFSAKLRGWLDYWEEAGSMEAIATAIHGYLGNHPRVRVINRGGRWVTVDEDGTLTSTDAPWDWDSVSHPGRASYWSEMWIVIYPTQWALREGTLGDLTGDDDGFGLGHMATHQEVDAVTSILADLKSAHSRVRAVIWTSDATLFDPEDPDTCPDGEWGAWGTSGSGSRVKSNRNITTCRYWEPG